MDTLGAVGEDVAGMGGKVAPFPRAERRVKGEWRKKNKDGLASTKTSGGWAATGQRTGGKPLGKQATNKPPASGEPAGKQQ